MRTFGCNKRFHLSGQSGMLVREPSQSWQQRLVKCLHAPFSLPAPHNGGTKPYTHKKQELPLRRLEVKKKRINVIKPFDVSCGALWSPVNCSKITAYIKPSKQKKTRNARSSRAHASNCQESKMNRSGITAATKQHQPEHRLQHQRLFLLLGFFCCCAEMQRLLLVRRCGHDSSEIPKWIRVNIPANLQ